MRRDRAIEAERSLRDAEARLLADLLAVLPGVAQSGAPLFTNRVHIPSRFHESKIWPEAQRLYEESFACVDARNTLAWVVDGSVGQLFIQACEELASDDPQRRGPRRLAEQLIEHLGRA